MLTKLLVRNFKRFEEIEIDLGQAVVLIGPNNSGKTTALQALALWDVGYKQWQSKRAGKSSPEKRPGVTINRRDLVSVPIPSANLLWKDTHTRMGAKDNGKTKTQNIRIEILVHGVTNGQTWQCGFEFDYANEESFYCRPLRTDQMRLPVPNLADKMNIAYLPPMSGLADQEFFKQTGEINVLIGQGQTAQVLRNLCFQIWQKQNGQWDDLFSHIKSLFGVKLAPPQFYPERGEITMKYQDISGQALDLSSAGRGLQQTLLLLAHIYANPHSVLLLDEPDAHLEILRQRQIFNLLLTVAEKQNSQIIAASHSEVVLNEAAGRGQVIAFVGKPHSLTDRGSQVLKSLTTIGFDQYYQAEQNGWVLYLENSTDLAILQAFAELLQHNARQYLARPFVHYVASNVPQKARDHFYGLREGKADLVGVAIFDRLESKLNESIPLAELVWEKREIENYFCTKEVLMAFAENSLHDAGDLFGQAEKQARMEAMSAAISELENALATLGRPSAWSNDVKATDEVLDPLFKNLSEKQHVPLLLRKNEYYKLVKYLKPAAVHPEIKEKLDAIVKVAKLAKPAAE